MNFDYSKIPSGFYDEVLEGPLGMRRFWHFHKFESVVRYIPDHLKGKDKAILDIGCFAGSFLGMMDEQLFGYQLGVDILQEQISFASKKYGNNFRKFKQYNGELELGSEFQHKFHVITLIEVIEHLTPSQILNLLMHIEELLHPEGRLILTTPNYMSAWPVIEILLNLVSDVKYEEQHITKFTFSNIDEKIKRIFPDLPLQLDQKTTTHFFTPYIALLNYKLALDVSQQIPSSQWNNQFGNLILTSWKKKSL